MSNLSYFLRENVEKTPNLKYVASDRMKDEEGNPVEWELRAISAEENNRIQNRCTKRVQVKPGLFQKETDNAEYMAKLAVACVVFPDLTASILQDSYEVLTPEALITTMLESGEYTALLIEINKLNKFDEDPQEKIKEAKNS